MTAKEYLLEIGCDNAHIPELFNNDDKSYYKISELIEAYHQEKLKTLDIAVLLSDENIKKMANEYTGGEEGYGAFILACNVIAKKIRKLC